MTDHKNISREEALVSINRVILYLRQRELDDDEAIEIERLIAKEWKPKPLNENDFKDRHLTEWGKPLEYKEER
jgi:hypothetical protein